jgi:hypothetical protein
MGFGTTNIFMHRLRSTISNKLTASMAGTSESGSSNALGMGPSFRSQSLPCCCYDICILFYHALDHCVYMVYEHPVVLAAMDYNMIMLAMIIHNLNMLCSHVFNHDRMIKLTIYDNIIAMINYLYVISFMWLLF